jgi:CIC family chloride channel protein
VLYGIEDVCDRVWRGPEWLRPAIGGILLGLLLLAVPQMYGVGYPVLGDGVTGRYAVGTLLFLLVAKIVATSLTIGIGGSGGVFAPSLFAGAMLGAAFGQTAAALAPGASGAAGAFALVGMAAVFAGAARAPITAVLVVFELTGEYSLILPLMLAVSLATGVSSLLSRTTVYTAKLVRRGVDLDAAPPSWAGAHSVRDVMGAVPPALHPGTSLPTAADALGGATGGELPVTDSDGRLLGVLTAEALAERMDDHGGASDPTRWVEIRPTVAPDATVADGLDLMERHSVHALPVLDGDRLVGWFTAAGVLDRIRGASAGG